jgi:hypothetical protein
MTLKILVNSIIEVINSAIVPLIFALAFIFFLWAVFNYFILGATDPKKRDEGKKYVLWGLVGLVVMFSVWGILNLLLSTLGISPRV